MTTEDEAMLHAQHTHQHRTPRKRGTTLVAIEGIDGTGKTTLARNLATLLGAQHISFPDRTPGAPATQLIEDALHGRSELGQSPVAMALLFAVDRATRRADLTRPGLTIVDRYTASSVAYTNAQGGEHVHTGWIGLTEHIKLQLPVPDLHILLDMPVNKAQQRLGRRTTTDEYEGNHNLQHHVAAEYHNLARKNWLSPWTTINAALPEEEVTDIAAAVIRYTEGRNNE